MSVLNELDENERTVTHKFILLLPDMTLTLVFPVFWGFSAFLVCVGGLRDSGFQSKVQHLSGMIPFCCRDNIPTQRPCHLQTVVICLPGSPADVIQAGSDFQSSSRVVLSRQHAPNYPELRSGFCIPLSTSAPGQLILLTILLLLLLLLLRLFLASAPSPARSPSLCFTSRGDFIRGAFG